MVEGSQLIDAVFTGSCSPNSRAAVLGRLGRHCSPEQLQQLKKHYLEEFHGWAGKDHARDALAIYIDGLPASGGRLKARRMPPVVRYVCRRTAVPVTVDWKWKWQVGLPPRGQRTGRCVRATACRSSAPE